MQFISSAQTTQESDMMSCLIGLQGNQFHYQTHQRSSSSKHNIYIVEVDFCYELMQNVMNFTGQTTKSNLAPK